MTELSADPGIRMREQREIVWIEAELGAYRAVFSTRLGGVSSPPRDSMNLGLHLEPEPLVAVTNREMFCDAVGADLERVVLTRQVHGTDLLLVTEEHAGSGSRDQESCMGTADGLVRPGSGPSLVMQVADCAPAIIVEPESGAGAAVHAGWRGAAGGIVEAAVSVVSQLTSVPPAGLLAAVGPCVRSGEYRVGAEVHAAFAAWGEDRATLFERTSDGLSLDLGRAVVLALLRAGLPREAVRDTGACTMARSDLFYSYRRDGSETGRLWGMLI